MWTMRAILMHATGEGARKYLPAAVHSPPDSTSTPLLSKKSSNSSVPTDPVEDIATIFTSDHGLTLD